MKDFFRISLNDVFIILVIALTALAAFGLGRLSVLYNSSSGFEVLPLTNSSTYTDTLSRGDESEQNFVASRHGSKYHFPWCSGAQVMNEENKIWFGTRKEAEQAGYTPAANCEGL
ncbi:MAG: hypothetical protein ACJKTH_02990 [Patescibacteria group bacterium UBA2163]